MFIDPFRVQYQTYDGAYEEEPWFRLEQEYFLMDPAKLKPLGFPFEGEPKSKNNIIVVLDLKIILEEK